MILIFNKLIYFDKKSVLDYNSSMQKNIITEMKEIEVTKCNSKGMNLKIANLDKNDTVNYKGEVYNSQSKLYDEFLENLANNDYYIDFINNEDKSINFICDSIIIKIKAEIYIPDEFDKYSILNSMPNEVIQNLIISGCDVNEDDKDLAKCFFKIKNSTLPVCIDYSGKLMCSKLKNENFLCSLEEFEDYTENEFIILARVINTRKKDKEIYNPLKDLFCFSRGLRRMIDADSNESLKNIYVDKDYINLEILAISQ